MQETDVHSIASLVFDCYHTSMTAGSAGIGHLDRRCRVVQAADRGFASVCEPLLEETLRLLKPVTMICE